MPKNKPLFCPNLFLKRCCTFAVLFFALALSSQILPERERAAVKDAMLTERFNKLLPRLMDRTGIDMWLIISREYNEDPVMRTMLPATWLNARRRTMLVFYARREKDLVQQ
ncbi:MAG: hypothetical protein ACPGQR_01165 [Marinirhabdus sp.]